MGEWRHGFTDPAPPHWRPCAEQWRSARVLRAAHPIARGFQLVSRDSMLFVFAQVVSVATEITQIISSVCCGAFPMLSPLIQGSHTAFCVWWYLVQRDGIPPKAEYKQLAQQIGFWDGVAQDLSDGAGSGSGGQSAADACGWGCEPVRGGALPLTFSLMNKDSRLHLLSLQDLRTGKEGAELWLADLGASRALSPQVFGHMGHIFSKIQRAHLLVFINTSVTVIIFIIMTVVTVTTFIFLSS